jgi:hypothetical protein
MIMMMIQIIFIITEVVSPILDTSDVNDLLIGFSNKTIRKISKLLKNVLILKSQQENRTAPSTTTSTT